MSNMSKRNSMPGFEHASVPGMRQGRIISPPSNVLWIEAASWLSNNVLLAVGEGSFEDDACPRVTVIADDQSVQITPSCVSFEQSQIASESAIRTLLIIEFPPNLCN